MLRNLHLLASNEATRLHLEFAVLLCSFRHSSIVDIALNCMIVTRSRGEMDITAVFGTAIPGSNPGGSTSGVLRTRYLNI